MGGLQLGVGVVAWRPQTWDGQMYGEYNKDKPPHADD